MENCVIYIKLFILAVASLITGVSTISRKWYINFFVFLLCIIVETCLAYLFLHSFWGYVIFVVFLVNPLMLLLAFERTAPKALAVLYFRLLIVYAGLGGLVSLLDLYLPAEIRDFLLPLACALFFLLTVIASILQARKREQREVAILVCGHVEKMQALADTCNLLREPISGKPVCVVSEDY